MNSVYGKMGEEYRLETHRILTDTELNIILQDKSIEISYIVELGSVDVNLNSNTSLRDVLSNKSNNKYVTKDLNFVSYLGNNDYSNDNIDLLNTFKGSIPIASEIAAISRVNMSLLIKYLQENKYGIYYMDTDSIVVDRPLPDHLVNNTELGKLKLEHHYKEAVFLAPKVYGGVTSDGKEIIKIKGLSHNTISKDVTFETLKSLLIKDKSLVFNQIKSFSKFDNATINLMDQTYNLIPTQNKRQLIFDNNLLIGTKPYTIGQDKTIK